MDTETLTVAYAHTFDCIVRADGETHYRKVLPCLSVVTPIGGGYEVSLDGQPPAVIREGECFVVPGGVAHTIVHHYTPGAVMHPRFIFIQILHSGHIDLTAAIRPPLVVRDEQATRLIALINSGMAAEAEGGAAAVFSRSAIAQSAFAQLLRLSPPLQLQHAITVDAALQYIEEHLGEKLTLDALGKVIRFELADITVK